MIDWGRNRDGVTQHPSKLVSSSPETSSTYPVCFEKIGQLEGVVKLETDPSVALFRMEAAYIHQGRAPCHQTEGPAKLVVKGCQTTNLQMVEQICGHIGV